MHLNNKYTYFLKILSNIENNMVYKQKGVLYSPPPPSFIKCNRSKQSATENFPSHLNQIYTVLHFNIILPTRRNQSLLFWFS